MSCRVRKIGPRTETVAGNKIAGAADYFVRDWDKPPGAMQKMQRVADRATQGQKMTPPGPRATKKR